MTAKKAPSKKISKQAQPSRIQRAIRKMQDPSIYDQSADSDQKDGARRVSTLCPAKRAKAAAMKARGAKTQAQLAEAVAAARAKNGITLPPGALLYIALPWPPSVNQVWNVGKGGHVYLSPAGKRYRQTVVEAIMRDAADAGLTCRLAVKVWAYAPDERDRDLDNLFKSLLDALQAADVYKNDSQIDKLDIVRCSRRVRGGAVIVQLTEFVSDDEPEINQKLVGSIFGGLSIYPDA